PPVDELIGSLPIKARRQPCIERNDDLRGFARRDPGRSVDVYPGNFMGRVCPIDFTWLDLEPGLQPLIFGLSRSSKDDHPHCVSRVVVEYPDPLAWDVAGVEVRVVRKPGAYVSHVWAGWARRKTGGVAYTAKSQQQQAG